MSSEWPERVAKPDELCPDGPHTVIQSLTRKIIHIRMDACSALRRWPCRRPTSSRHAPPGPGRQNANPEASNPALTLPRTWVMALLATSFSSTPPRKTWTVRLVTNWDAMAFTSRGHVAEKNSVCRCAGMLRTIFVICEGGTGRFGETPKSDGVATVPQIRHVSSLFLSEHLYPCELVTAAAAATEQARRLFQTMQ